MPKAVFFDLDGTLYDRRGLRGRMVLAALFRGPKPLRCLRLMALERDSRKRLGALSYETIGYDTLFSLMASRCRLSPGEVREWYDGWYMPRIVAELQAHYSIDGDMLRKAGDLRAEGVKVAILSDYGHIREKLEALGAIPSAFDALLDAPSLGGFKPSPNVFRSACQFLGVDPSDCEMIGDRPDTDGGCQAIGMKFTQIKKGGR